MAIKLNYDGLDNILSLLLLLLQQLRLEAPLSYD